MTIWLRSSVQTRFRIVRNTLIVDLKDSRRVLSSAPQGGGFTTATYVLNHQVESTPVDKRPRPSPGWGSPSRYLRKLASELGLTTDTVGLMTAVPMTQLVTARVSSGKVWVECFATVGVTNAVRAGEWPALSAPSKPVGTPGTINLILVTNASLSKAALVGAVQVATESKAGVLRDHAVPSWTGHAGATGTGTDAVVIASRTRGRGPWHVYSGTHTVIGALLGRAVTACITRGLAKAKRWRERHR
jgi:iron complex transport system ATP-binding protein